MATKGKVKPGLDLDIIACERAGVPDDAAPGTRCVGVRWASRNSLGFPAAGYELHRRIVGDMAGSAISLGTFLLPDTSDWDAFAADVTARRPAHGPWFEAITPESHDYLIPLIRLIDPRTPAGELRALVLSAGEFFDGIHEEDAELAWNYWGYGSPPPLDALLDDDPVTADALTRFYKSRATEFLLALATRFEYAVLLGLATDDLAPAADVQYIVQTSWPDVGFGSAESDPVPTNSPCSPAAPSWFRLERIPGTARHPAFEVWPDWAPPAGFGPTDGDGNLLPAEALVPRYPAAYTALNWAEGPPKTRLLDHGSVLYRVGRYTHGAATAALGTAPALPAGAAFEPIGEGEDLIRPPAEPHYTDVPPTWSEFEGYYHYEIRGVDLLGVPSSTALRAAIRHFDDIAPASPRLRVMADEPSVSLAADASELTVPLEISWDAAEEFAGPDVAEFRVAASWIQSAQLPVHIDTVASADTLQADVTLTTLAGTVDAYIGGRLCTANGDFPIVSHTVGASAVVRVRKLGTRIPSAGSDAMVMSAGTPSQITRLAAIPRIPLVAASVVQVESFAPIRVELSAEDGAELPDDAVIRAYIHALRITVDARLVDDGLWELEAPLAELPARETWDEWLAHDDPGAILAGSPVLVFPLHKLEVVVPVPAGFTAGLINFYATAADDASYVESPSLPTVNDALLAPKGNESSYAEAFLSVRSEKLPDTPTVPAYDPAKRIWARSAGLFAESAQYDVQWTPSPGAVRYEVWRALEAGIPGAEPGTTDEELRTLGADINGFELRTGQAFGGSYTDALPGRAPTRALYTVRPISAAGVPGEFSPLIGPVYVPDIRRPLKPNLLKANAAPSSEADRTIVLEWTQSGPKDDVRFDVYFQDAASVNEEWTLAGTIPMNSAASYSGRYRFLHRERPPGKKFEYRIVAVREALDPVDPDAQLRRDIGSEPSLVQEASAISSTPLAAPVSLSAELTNGSITLTWENRDWYEGIEVWRKSPNQYMYDLVATVPGDTESYEDATAPSGLWLYQLRAKGIRREARSAIDAEIDKP